MSMLIEKRQAIAKRIEDALAERTARINAKLVAYKAQLDAEPLSEEIIKAQHILAALDEVISYENSEMTKETTPVTETVVEPIAESVNEVVEEVAENKIEEIPSDVKIDTENVKVDIHISEDARPGMAYIGIPERS